MTRIIGSTYEIVEQLGAGGGGIVYLANHIRLNKQVVLKADRRKITTPPALLRRGPCSYPSSFFPQKLILSAPSRYRSIETVRSSNSVIS